MQRRPTMQHVRVETTDAVVTPADNGRRRDGGGALGHERDCLCAREEAIMCLIWFGTVPYHQPVVCLNSNNNHNRIGMVPY